MLHLLLHQEAILPTALHLRPRQEATPPITLLLLEVGLDLAQVVDRDQDRGEVDVNLNSRVLYLSLLVKGRVTGVSYVDCIDSVGNKDRYNFANSHFPFCDEQACRGIR